jgi:protein SCO1/2
MSPTPPPAAEAPARSARADAWFGGLLLLLVVAALGGGFWAHKALRRSPGPDPGSRRLQAFRLTERSGRTVTDTELRGRWLVVSFVDTSCSLSCRIVTQSMASLQRLTQDQADVQLVSIGIDPPSDTPSVLREFAGKFGADANRWLFLTGETAAVYELISGSFLTQEPELIGAMPGGFADADHIVLVDRQGKVRSYINGVKPDSAARVLAELKRLQAETE